MQQGQRSYASLPLLMEPRIVIMLHCGNAERRQLRKLDSQMASFRHRHLASPEPTPSRGRVLRLLDTLAAWQMRHSHEVIARVQTDSATITGVNQPSSANERSSISPCDR